MCTERTAEAASSLQPCWVAYFSDTVFPEFFLDSLEIFSINKGAGRHHAFVQALTWFGWAGGKKSGPFCPSPVEQWNVRHEIRLSLLDSHESYQRARDRPP